MSITENLDNKIKEFWTKNGPPTQEIEKYVKKYSKEKIVIKCGGRVLLDPNLFNNFINDVTILKKLGLTPIVVHGGGPRIKKKLDELSRFKYYIYNTCPTARLCESILQFSVSIITFMMIDNPNRIGVLFFLT